MTKVSYTRLAREDLLDIWTYIAPRNPDAADRVFDLLEARCSSLRDYPQSGPGRPEIADDARALVVERWIVLYRLTGDGVQVVRIVDGARDLSKLKWTEIDS